MKRALLVLVTLAKTAGDEVVLGSWPGRVSATGRAGVVPRFAVRQRHSPARLRAVLDAGPRVWFGDSLRFELTHRTRLAWRARGTSR